MACNSYGEKIERAFRVYSGYARALTALALFAYAMNKAVGDSCYKHCGSNLAGRSSSLQKGELAMWIIEGVFDALGALAQLFFSRS